MKSPVSLIILASFLSMLTACASLEQGERRDDLWQALASYRKLIRWGYYEDAARYQLPEGEHQAQLDLEYLKGIHITAYEELERVLTSEDSVDVHVKISFYHEDYGSVKTIRDVQQWKYVPEAKRWFLDDDLPDLHIGSEATVREVPRTRKIEIK